MNRTESEYLFLSRVT